MFGTINEAFNREKRREHDELLIVESVLGTEEVVPGSEEEFEDVVDVDSVPEEVYKKVDAELDRIVGDPNYDDTDAEELVDDDDDIDDSEINAVIDEAACNMADTFWYDDERIGHPNTDIRNKRGEKKDCHCQPKFEAKNC